MRVHELKSTPVDAQLICDRCAAQARHDEGDGLNNFLQLGFDAGWGSALGDGTRVDIDLCHSCLKETLGPWLRLSMSAWASASAPEA